MSNWKRFSIAGDIHGDKQDTHAVEAFLKFNATWNPEIRVLNGDVWDFRPLRKKATAEEKRESMAADYEAGMQFFERYLPTKFNRGNHDERLWDLAHEGDGILRDYALKGVGEIEERLRELRCEMRPYNTREGILHLGHLKITHGFGNSAVGAARKHAQVYGSIVVNHFHSIQQASIEGIDNRIGRVIGCLCLLNMNYSRATLGALMHRHGWLYGVSNTKTGDYHCWQASDVNGRWMLPSDVVEI